jgi:hypothetical protein
MMLRYWAGPCTAKLPIQFTLEHSHLIRFFSLLVQFHN